MNLEYLQNTHTFHVERIMDYLSHNLPLCALHQTRTIVFFCYIFAFIIEFLLYPPYSIGNTPYDQSTLFLPLIIVVILHLLLIICYVFGALFERANCMTTFALLFLLHAALPFVITIGTIIIVNKTEPNYYFNLSITLAVAFFLDFICGVISRPSQRIVLLFEIIACVPSFILTALYFNNTISQVWISFIPSYIYLGFYFIFLLFLAPFCRPCHHCTLSFLSNPEIGAEFDAAIDPQLKPFKNRAYWEDEPDVLGSDHGNRRERASRWNRNQDENMTRFPTRAEFQLYNVDATPENPIYLASPLPMLALTIVLSVALVHCLTPLSNFYFWFAAALAILVFAVLLNSRSTACSFLSFTNLDDKCVDILWDHPSLSIL